MAVPAASRSTAHGTQGHREAGRMKRKKANRYGRDPQPDDGLLPSPRDCMRVRGTGRRCDTCGAVAAVLHVPMRQRGQFCAVCCPCCAAVGPEVREVTG